MHLHLFAGIYTHLCVHNMGRYDKTREGEENIASDTPLTKCLLTDKNLCIP